MPTLSCPHCSATVTVRKPVAVGKKVTCPRCDKSFRATDESDGPPDAIPDEDHAPRRRPGGGDDADDRRSRSRTDDRSRPRRHDEDGDRARSRRPRHDEDDDRPKRTRRKKRRNVLGIILPLAGVGLLVIAGAIYLLFFRGGSGGLGGSIVGGGNVPEADMVAWAPEDTTLAVYLDYAVLNQHPAVDKANVWGLGKLPRFGLEPREVQAMFRSGMKPFGITVIRTAGALDEATMDRVVRSTSGVPATANGKGYFRTAGGGALYKAGDRLLVVADQEATLTRRLGKDEGKVVVSGEMRAYLGRATGQVWRVSVANKQATITRNGEPVEGEVSSITLTGDTVERTSESTFVNASAVERFGAQWRNQADAVIVTNGRRLTVTIKRPANFEQLSLMEFIW